MEPPVELWAESHRRAVLGWLREYTRGDERCEDWVQETFLRAWCLRDRFDGADPKASPVGWLVSLARNVAWQDLRPDTSRHGPERRQWLRPEHVPLSRYGQEPEDGGERWSPAPEVLLAPEWEEPEACALRNERRLAVWHTLAQLTPHQRLALWRAYAWGMSSLEQAGLAEAHPVAIRARVRLGRRYFLRAWQERNTA